MVFLQDVWRPYRVETLHSRPYRRAERWGKGSPTTKLLDCQTWDFSSSVVLSAAVLKQTPKQEGPRPHPFLKQAGGYLEDRIAAQHSRRASTHPVFYHMGCWFIGGWSLVAGRLARYSGMLWEHWRLSRGRDSDRQLEGSHSLWHHCPENHVTPAGRAPKETTARWWSAINQRDLVLLQAVQLRGKQLL